jgi:hypothetical protein
MQDYRKLVLSQDALKMNTLLQFTFNVELLRQHLRDPWMTIYDFNYIDKKIIGGIEKHLPAVAEVLRQVEKRATGKVTSALSLNGSNMNDTDARSQYSRMSGSLVGGRPGSGVSGAGEEFK